MLRLESESSHPAADFVVPHARSYERASQLNPAAAQPTARPEAQPPESSAGPPAGVFRGDSIAAGAQAMKFATPSSRQSVCIIQPNSEFCIGISDEGPREELPADTPVRAARRRAELDDRTATLADPVRSANPAVAARSIARLAMTLAESRVGRGAVADIISAHVRRQIRRAPVEAADRQAYAIHLRTQIRTQMLDEKAQLDQEILGYRKKIMHRGIWSVVAASMSVPSAAGVVRGSSAVFETRTAPGSASVAGGAFELVGGLGGAVGSLTGAYMLFQNALRCAGELSRSRATLRRIEAVIGTVTPVVP